MDTLYNSGGQIVAVSSELMNSLYIFCGGVALLALYGFVMYTMGKRKTDKQEEVE